jgi:hypothetical protein
MLIWMAMVALPALANDDDDDKPKPKPAPIVVTQPQEPDRYQQNLWGGAAFGALAVTAYSRSEHPMLYAIGTGIAAAAAVEAAQPGAFQGKNFRYAVGGIVLGAGGTGLVFGKRFFGWQTTFK